MLELFLNLLWLLIAVLAFGVWKAHLSGGGRAPGGQTRRSWIALGCALVLLFFVISMTDDLHSEVMLVEDATSSRRHVCSQQACPHHVTSAKLSHDAAPPAASQSLVAPRLSFSELVTPAHSPAILSRAYALPGRAPPSFSL